jgi:hypothetical protein
VENEFAEYIDETCRLVDGLQGIEEAVIRVVLDIKIGFRKCMCKV